MDTDTDTAPDWFTTALGELREAWGTGAWEADPNDDDALVGEAGGHLIRVERDPRDDGWFRAELLGEGDTEGMDPRSAAGAVRALLARVPRAPELRVVEGGRR